MIASRVRRAPVTEIELLKARYDEARAIKAAWDVRLRRAEAEHSRTIRAGGDFAATRRAIDAVETQVADAAGELKVALHAWTTACIKQEHHLNRSH